MAPVVRRLRFSMGIHNMDADMLEFKQPIPVILPDGGEGYAIYATNSGMYENDVWTVVLCDSGKVRHYTTDQIKIHTNATFGIRKQSKIY